MAVKNPGRLGELTMILFWVTRPRGDGNPSGCAETISVGRIGRLFLKGGQSLIILFLMGTDLDNWVLRRKFLIRDGNSRYNKTFHHKDASYYAVRSYVRQVCIWDTTLAIISQALMYDCRR